MGITWPAVALSPTLAAPAELTFRSDGVLFGLKVDGSGRAPLVAKPKASS
ncbi:hypothetical protein DVA67_032030 [Solirubrobacter sp. CPCC 204708]|uniref:Uncharacterized protein n=1 Tax=Solirubrobacter deserti TaxID=2282478 RepID=A0ABT4RQ96_9ACTN|nr:hypothetical protein [Solirubrobacter deserti]MBE2320633.1 hypothetical protein [Solirubrobacter deserti]MDA0140687.1 hypothetical protein [Solirubrobacter deserti]